MSRIERQTIPSVSVSDFNLAQSENASTMSDRKRKSYSVFDANANGVTDDGDEFYRHEWRRETWTSKLWQSATERLDAQHLPRDLLKALRNAPEMADDVRLANRMEILKGSLRAIARDTTELEVIFSAPEVHTLSEGLAQEEMRATIGYSAVAKAAVYADGQLVRELSLKVDLGAVSAADDKEAIAKDYETQIRSQLTAPLTETQAQVFAELEPGRLAVQDFTPEILQKLAALNPGATFTPLTSVEIDPAGLRYTVGQDGHIEKSISRASLYAALSSSSSVDFSQLNYVIFYQRTHVSDTGESVTEPVYVAIPTAELAGLTDPAAMREKLADYTSQWFKPQEQSHSHAHGGSWSSHRASESAPSAPWPDGRTVTLYDTTTNRFYKNQVEGGQLKAGQYVQTPNGRVKIKSTEREDGSGVIYIETDED